MLFNFGKKRIEAEAARLAFLLNIQAGSKVAEIGAGKGEMTEAFAKLVGPDGHVYSTESDPKRLQKIRRKVEKAKFSNITVIQGEQERTSLPSEYCNAVFMRKVYHHLKHPETFNQEIFRCLRSGGLLGVIDFAPRFWLSLFARPKDVPQNRQGHGIPKDILIKEVLKAGFELVRQIDDWSGKTYCLIFRKP